MAEETTPIWREALQNRDHELYTAAWTVFSENMNVDVASSRFNDNQDTVVPFLSSIIQDEDLYEQDKLGGGNAPMNALRLIGEWAVVGQLPTLLERLEDTASYQQVYHVLMGTIVGMGDAVVDDVINWATENEDMRPEAAEILNRIGAPKAYDVILGWMEPDEFQLEKFADYLSNLDPERAVNDLHALSTNQEFEKEERKDFKEKSKAARKLARQRKKDAEAAAARAAEIAATIEETTDADDAESTPEAVETESPADEESVEAETDSSDDD